MNEFYAWDLKRDQSMWCALCRDGMSSISCECGKDLCKPCAGMHVCRFPWSKPPTNVSVRLTPPPMDCDPRPDLLEDSMSWMFVLRAAVATSMRVWSLLHVLRIYGATLRWSEMGRLHLEWKEAVPKASGHGTQWILDNWLKPLTNEISAVFRRVESGE